MLETKSLLLRKISENDTEQIFECWMKDRDVSKYMWWKASNDIKDAEEFVKYELSQLFNEKWNRWIIELKSSGTMIGTCLVYYNEDEDESHWDISYNLGKKYWGKGYATEAMREVIHFAEEELGMGECITSYAKENTASATVLHKLGFEDIREIPYECEGGTVLTDGILCRYTSEKSDIYECHMDGTFALTEIESQGPRSER